MREATSVGTGALCRLGFAPSTQESARLGIRVRERKRANGPETRTNLASGPTRSAASNRSAFEDDQVLRLRPEAVSILDLEVAAERRVVARRDVGVVEALPRDDRVMPGRIGNLNLMHRALIDRREQRGVESSAVAVVASSSEGYMALSITTEFCWIISSDSASKDALPW